MRVRMAPAGADPWWIGASRSETRFQNFMSPSEAPNITAPLLARGEHSEALSAPVAPAAPVETTGSQWDVATKRTVVVILLVACVGVFWISQPVIPLLIISGIVAYLLHPIVDFCERIYIPRSVSTIVLFVLLLVGLILLPVILVPILLQQLRVLSDFDVNRTTTIFIQWVSERLNSLPDTIELFGSVIPLGDSLHEVEANFQEYIVLPTLAEALGYIQQLIGTATSLVGSTAWVGITVVGSIVQVFVTFILTFFLSLYLTKDAPLIRAYVQGLFPRAYQTELGGLLAAIGHIWQSFFRGQIALCITVGVITGLALQIVGMPGALILGIVAGALEVIPSLGPTLAMIPAVIVALIQGSDVLAAYGISNLGFAVITVAIYFIIQQLENSIIVPRVIGSSVNLHPVVVICGVVVGYNVAGIGGAFLAAPVIASFRVIGGYLHAKLLDYPPFQEHPSPPSRFHRPFTYRRTVKGGDLASQPAVTRAPSTILQANSKTPRPPLSDNPQTGHPLSSPSGSEAKEPARQEV
jgi:predicted PurR-regulated permease PerM